jgi:polyphosphate kinase
MIDRFLEHGRAFHFANGGKDEVYISSADWMPRNFHRRVEVMVPIEDPVLRGRLQEILSTQASDNVKSWRLQSDGKYVRVVAKPGQPVVRCQQRFMEMTRDKVKVGDAATRQSSRFHLSARQPIIGYDGSTPATRRSRRQRKDAKS